MALTDERYLINPEKVVCDIVDDEAILIHLESGNYYSLRGSGAAIWRDLQAGLSRDGLIATLVARHAADRDLIGASVARFVAQLVAEELIAIRPCEAVAAAPGAASTTSAFEPPSLEKFSDLADLLLLDPIHEVDAQRGWPVRPAESV